MTVLLCVFLFVADAQGMTSASFGEFDRRAKAGERLDVVFFGASLTWGSNATDPQLTSYRAKVARRLQDAYPQAHFAFHDASIGGTNSQLAVFRLDRDVLRHKPDLVFLDFSANDDINTADTEKLAAYESLLWRIIEEGRAPVVQMIFPFGWDVKSADFDRMKRRAAHLSLSKAYGTAVGDAISLAVQRVKAGEMTVEQIWPFDLVHPGDVGYQLFADVAWAAFQDAVRRDVVCKTPKEMVHGETYRTQSRVRISTLGELPKGWRNESPNLTSAYFDMLMSRWLEDEVVASNRVEIQTAEEEKRFSPQQVDRLKVSFRGNMVLLFGEGTTKSVRYRAYIDGKLVKRMRPGAKEPMCEFDSASISARANGNTHHVAVIAENLAADRDHTLEIEPLFSPELEEQELRLESICVAGGDAEVFPFPSNDSPILND
ncbi:SGNH/GDSL hydrolase family protein, partial [Rhodopirellula sallentina]|uniref:SGNH/GDSL hydrolase family protein n=1 Tax=Rhodopirellula sallentina TaxID=1263869 RepID=UPI001F16CCA1